MVKVSVIGHLDAGREILMFCAEICTSRSRVDDLLGFLIQLICSSNSFLCQPDRFEGRCNNPIKVTDFFVFAQMIYDFWIFLPLYWTRQRSPLPARRPREWFHC